MRLSPLQHFRKLYGVIKDDVKEGTYELSINNSYDVSKWDGEKHLVLATMSSLGGKTNGLAALCLASGFLGCISAVIFALMACGMKDRINRKDLTW